MVRCQSKINYSEKSISCAIVGNNNKRQKRTEFKCKRTEAEMTHSESNDTNIEHFLHRFQADDDSQFQNTRLVHGFFFFFLVKSLKSKTVLQSKRTNWRRSAWVDFQSGSLHCHMMRSHFSTFSLFICWFYASFITNIGFVPFPNIAFISKSSF